MAGEAFGFPRTRCTAGSIQSLKRFPIPYQRESVGTDAVHDRLDHCQGGSRGNRGIDRIAPAQQHAQSRLGGQRLRCGHDIASQHGHAAGWIGKFPVHISHRYS